NVKAGTTNAAVGWYRPLSPSDRTMPGAYDTATETGSSSASSCLTGRASIMISPDSNTPPSAITIVALLRPKFAVTSAVRMNPPITAPGWLIDTINADPVPRHSDWKHSAWKYMMAAYGPSRKNSPSMYIGTTNAALLGPNIMAVNAIPAMVHPNTITFLRPKRSPSQPWVRYPSAPTMLATIIIIKALEASTPLPVSNTVVPNTEKV